MQEKPNEKMQFDEKKMERMRKQFTYKSILCMRYCPESQLKTLSLHNR